ncbi:hypothetical protein [Mariniluteicoccus endophyticus]
MVVLAYLLGVVYTHGLYLVGAAVVLFFLWSFCQRDGLRLLRIPLGILLLAVVGTLGFYTFDMSRRSDGATGELIAKHGEPAKIELVKQTGSHRTTGRRRSASIDYDVVIRYADGTSVSKNLDILDIPATEEGWRIIVESTAYEARCLPKLREACSVVGRAA